MPKKFSALSIIMCVAFVLSSLLMGACNKKKTVEPKTLEATKGPVQPLDEVKVPTQVFAWAVAGNPQKLFTNIESLSAKAAPVPSGTIGESINKYLLDMGFKDTSVIDLSAPAGVLILNTMKYPIPFLMAVSTKGQKPFLASLKPQWKQKSENEGIHELSREVVDPYSVFKGGQNAAKAKKTEQSMYIRFEGATALIALAPSVIQDSGKAILDRLKDAVPADGINAAIHLDNIRAAFAVQLSMMPQVIKQQINKVVTELPPQLMLSPKFARWMLGWLSDKGFAFLQQTKEITLAVGVNAQEAIFHTAIVAEPDSFFAKFLKEQKHTPLKLANGLPDGPFLAMGMNIQWKSLKKDMLLFTQEAFEKFTNEKISDETMKLFKGWLETTGEEICLVENLGKSGSFEIVELIEINDEKKADELMKKIVALMAEMYSSKSGLMGIRATLEGPKPAGEVDGVKLSETVVAMDLSALAPLQAQAIKTIYKDGRMRFMTAIFNKTIVLSMGKNCEKNLKDTIVRLKKGSGGFTSSQAYTSAAGQFGKDSGGFMYLSLSNFIHFSTAQFSGQKDQKPIPPPKSGIYMKFSVDGRTMISSIRLPAAHLEELGKAIQSLTQLSGPPQSKTH